MNIKMERCFLASDFLSDIELYYASPGDAAPGKLIIKGEEFQHMVRVMRHVVNDTVHVTNGSGKIYICRIEYIGKDNLIAGIEETLSYDNPLDNITFCFTKLKNPDRFEFALEKCVELGITRFIIFNSMRSATKGDKPDRWNKIAASAMKQSLRSYLPEIGFRKDLSGIIKLDGIKVIMDQKAEPSLKDFRPEPGSHYYFIFGPEGGLDDKEIKLAGESLKYHLTPNRLRAETAVMTAAAVITASV